MTKEFGQLLAYYRKECNLTQNEVASSAQGDSAADSSLLSKAERGIANLSPKSAVKIADILNVPHERRVEFLLLAVGHEPQMVYSLLEQTQYFASPDDIAVAQKEQEEQEITLTLRLQRTRKGWRVIK